MSAQEDILAQMMQFEVPETKARIPMENTAAYTEILNHAENCFTVCKDNRMQFERQWYTNIAFYFGKQWVIWANDGTVNSLGRLIMPPAPSWKVRLTSNQVRRYIRKEHSKATREVPTGYILPGSGEDSDLKAAKAGEAIIEHVLREITFQKKMRSAVFWACITGNGFLKDRYKKADPDEDAIEDMPMVDMIIPFNMYVPDIVQEGVEDQPYVVHAAMKSKDFVRNTYKIAPEEHKSSSAGGNEEKFLQAMGISDRLEKDQVYVKEAWMKPCEKYKEGAVVVWSGTKILYFVEGWPYKHKEYPFTKIDHIPTGRFYNESAITDLIPLQKEYNRTRSQIIEAKNKTSKPQLLAQEGSINTNKVTSEPGLIIMYKPGFEKPTPLPLQPLPAYVSNEVDRNKSDMDDIVSQHEVSRGQAPPGVEAATAISYLQEQDDSVLTELTRSVESGTERICRHLLYHVQENWELDRTIRVTGLNNQIEAYEFSQANLEGNTDWVVQTGSATPRSRAGNEARIMDLMDKGLIPPERGLMHLELASAGRLFEELQVDSRQAQRENLRMARGAGLPEQQVDQFTGEPVPIDLAALAADPTFVGLPINSWDQDVIHITEHDAYKKRQEYESATPEVKFLFERHDRLHKMKLISNYGGMIPDTGDPAMDAAILNGMAFRVMNGIPLDPNAAPVAESSQEASQE